MSSVEIGMDDVFVYREKNDLEVYVGSRTSILIL